MILKVQNNLPKLPGTNIQIRFRAEKALINGKYEQSFWQRFYLAAKDSFWEYTEKTKVSGMWLLRKNRTEGLTRWIWSTVLIKLLLLACFLAIQLWLKFYSYPILNTISTNLPITEVAFPGVTVCSPKVVNKERVASFIRRLKIPAHYNLTEIAIGFDFLNAFTDQNWIAPPEGSQKAADEILRLNNVSIYEAANEVSAGCEEFVRRCFWGSDSFGCRQDHEYLSFIPTTSYLGPCCSFNYNPRNASYVPFSANIFGMDGGLIFIGIEGSEQNISTGLIVLVHHPMDFVTEATASVTITTDSESFVEIVPTVQSSSVEVLELAQNKRDCLISNDLDLRNYRQASCLLNCQSEVIFKQCKCHPYHLPTWKQEYKDKECKLADAGCFSRNFEHFKSVRCTHCLPNCYDVTYSTLAYKTDILLHNYSISGIYSHINETKDTFIVRVYLSQQTVPSIRKVTVMSWIGLLSDLGGVFNLCLGLSIISLVEFFYYSIYRLYVNFNARTVLLQSPVLK